MLQYRICILPVVFAEGQRDVVLDWSWKTLKLNQSSSNTLTVLVITYLYYPGMPDINLRLMKFPGGRECKAPTLMGFLKISLVWNNYFVVKMITDNSLLLISPFRGWGYNFSIFHIQNPVAKFGQFFIVCNNEKSLIEFISQVKK